jgi:hypothetical protein
MLWVQKMNKCKSIVEELVIKENIYEEKIWLKVRKDITYKEFEEILLPFYDNYSEYLINFVIPDAIAFYLANGHSRNCLSDCPLINHINSAIDVFNVRCDTDKLIPEIEKILEIKYNLKIENQKPMRLKSVRKI